MDNKKKIVLLSLILLGFLSSVKVFGLYKLNTDTVRWDGGEGKSYDPFFLKQYVQSVQARIFFDKAVAGDTFITISKGGGDNYDRNFSVGTLSGRDFDTFSTQQLGYDRKARCGDFSLNYQLYGTTDVLIPLKALPEAQNYQDVISYSFSGQENSSISLQYYLDASHEIVTNYNLKKLYIFTDDISWVKQNLHLFPQVEREVLHPPKSSDPAESLILLSKCKFLSISNSTFSWWSAYLSRNNSKVWAPSPWYFGLDEPDQLLPYEWQKCASIWETN